MEKDNFINRPIESTLFSAVEIGDEVYVCEKHMQKIATELSHLTRGTVIQKLTRHDHPRGIKVKIDISGGNGAYVVGRVVYIKKNGDWITKE